MQNLSETSLIVADELRRAERSIDVATRDTAQFLVTTLDAAAAHNLPAVLVHGAVKRTIAALTALVDGQGKMVLGAHPAAEKVARHLGLTETSWGELVPKPNATVDEPAAIVAG